MIIGRINKDKNLSCLCCDKRIGSTVWVIPDDFGDLSFCSDSCAQEWSYEVNKAQESYEEDRLEDTATSNQMQMALTSFYP